MDNPNIVEIKLIDGKVVGYYMQKEITKETSVYNTLVKLARHVKGQ